MKQYRNLVFDVGGVLLGYRWKDMLTVDYGMSPERRDAFAWKIFSDPLWKEFDLENRPYDDVVEDYVRKYPSEEADIRWFFTHTELMHVGRPRIWELLRQLKEAGYRIYLLSNYSSVLFRNHTAGAPFLDWLDGKVVSCEVHVIKPDPAIYRALYERCGLDPAESLFFDDRQENVDGSIACGMDACRVLSEEQLAEELEELLAAV